jgi:hypothetical protein
MPNDGALGDFTDYWDWDAIRAEERAAQFKAARLPRCWVCGERMWCGQRDRHHTCTLPASTDPGQSELT